MLMCLSLASATGSCNYNQVRINGTCQCQYPPGYFYTNNSDNCVHCPYNKNYTANGSCICADPNAFISYNAFCMCQMGFTQINNGACQHCPNGSNPIYGTCVCPSPTILNNTDATCVLCPSYSVYVNGSFPSCTCQENMSLIMNITTQQCVHCPVNSVYSNGSCVCDATGNYTWNATQQQCHWCGLNSHVSNNNCICNGNCMMTDNFSCIPCPSNSVYAMQSCICNVPTVMNYTTYTCDPCFNPNQTYSNKSCICSQNYIQVGDGCQQCPKGMYWQNYSCYCNQLEYDNGSCQVCPSNSYYNNITCTCNDSNAQYNITTNQCQCYDYSVQQNCPYEYAITIGAVCSVFGILIIIIIIAAVVIWYRGRIKYMQLAKIMDGTAMKESQKAQPAVEVLDDK